MLMWPRIITFLFYLIALITAVPVNELIDIEGKSDSVETYRLPNNTKPVTYDLHFWTNIHKNETAYNGTATILLKVLNDTDRIVLHARLLEITQITLIQKENNLEYTDLTYTNDNITDFFTIFSSSTPLILEKDQEFVLKIKFRGNHSVFPVGFFKAFNEDDEGNMVPMAITHSQSHTARCIFPCYDEPALKSRFKITVTHGSNFSAISNMPVSGEPIQDENGLVTTIFRETPIMSTYIVAIVVSNYEYISLNMSGVEHRMYYPRGSKFKGEYALIVASRALYQMEKYFEIKFPLPKIDHIGVPTFRAGAMENWGLIIYRIERLFGNSEWDNLATVTASVVQHELAHQWFGNLVTFQWWDSVWLNEGFAVFYMMKFMNMLYPEYKTDTYFTLTYIANFVFEPFEGEPLTRYVETEKEIRKNFHPRTYRKGAAMINMFEHALSEPTFRKGIISYLKKFKYSNANENDLFECLQEVAIEDKIPFFGKHAIIKTSMMSWTQQANYPMLTIKRNYKTGTFTITQKPFNATNYNLWWIPITIATASNNNFEDTKTDLLMEGVKELEVDPTKLNITLLKGDWLLLNKKLIGIYRVNYDEQNWKLIIEALKNDPNSMHSLNKAQLIKDASISVDKEELPFEILFELLSYLKNELDPAPWIEGIFALNWLYYESENNEKEHSLLKYFARDIIKKFYEHFSKKSITAKTTLEENMKYFYKTFPCKIGLKLCLDNAMNELKNFHREYVPPIEFYEEVFKTLKKNSDI